jgi:hypothetical protein
MLDLETEVQPSDESTSSSTIDKNIRIDTLVLNQYNLKGNNLHTLKSSYCSNKEMIPLLNFPLHVTNKANSFFNVERQHLALSDGTYKLKVGKLNSYKLMKEKHTN